jgi:hypothetical protein
MDMVMEMDTDVDMGTDVKRTLTPGMDLGKYHKNEDKFHSWLRVHISVMLWVIVYNRNSRVRTARI